jgi:hypothetical protein
MVESKKTAIKQNFGLELDSSWNDELLEVLDQACADFSSLFEGTAPLWLRGIQVLIDRTIKSGGLTNPGRVRLSPNRLTKWTIVHELAHAWDFSTGRALSRELKKRTHSWVNPLGMLKGILKNRFTDRELFWYHAGSAPPPCGIDKNFNAMEDFAESVTAYLYPEEASLKALRRKKPYNKYGYSHFHETPRGQFIREVIARAKENALD